MKWLKSEGAEALRFFLYVTVSLFLAMLIIVLGFSVLIIFACAIENLTYLERIPLGLVQLLIFMPIVGSATVLTMYVRSKWLRFDLFGKKDCLE